MTDADAPAWRLSGEGAKADVEALAQALGEAEVPAAGCSLLARDRWRMEAFFDAEPDLDVLSQGLPEGPAARVALKVEALPDNDWVRMVLDGLPAVRAGRFLVAGAHVRDRAEPGDVVVGVEAAEAFGAGHHQTTLGRLRALDAVVRMRPASLHDHAGSRVRLGRPRHRRAQTSRRAAARLCERHGRPLRRHRAGECGEEFGRAFSEFARP